MLRALPKILLEPVKVSARSSLSVTLALAATLSLQTMVFAQNLPITAASDGTGTLVNQSGSTFNITGGTTSSSGANLFQSFSNFGLNTGQIANFQSNATIQNILSRVTGGNFSTIDGLIKVTGSNANLFLLNPAGIIFGPNASLNVPASFTATTANAVGFGSQWFNASGPNNYAALNGSPTSLALSMGQPGSIVNGGALSVGPGQQLSLIGGTVISTGALSGGQVHVAAVPGERYVRLGQPGNVLSLDVPVSGGNLPTNWNLPILSLPELLAGGSNSQLVVDSAGAVRLAGTASAIKPGDVVATNVITTDVVSTQSLISATGDVTFGNYTGVSLKVEAQGSITGGNVTITGNQTATNLGGANPADPDVAILITDPALILRAGVATLLNDVNTIPSGNITTTPGGNFSASTTATNPGNISVGDIAARSVSSASIGGLRVILSAPGNITTQQIDAFQGQIDITSANGSITTGNLSTSASGVGLNGGNITLSALNGNITSLLVNTGTSNVGNPSGGSSTAGNAGNVLITAGNNITTASISTNSVGNSSNTGNAGNITISSSNGNIVTDSLDASTNAFRSFTTPAISAGNGGTITLNATVGNIDVGTVSTTAFSADSLTGNGGNVVLTATAGNATLNAPIILFAPINTDSLINTGTNFGAAGNVTITAGNRTNLNGNITASSLDTTRNITGGTVVFNGDVRIATGNITVDTSGSGGGNSAGTAVGGNIVFNSGIDGATTSANLTLSSGSGNIALNGALGNTVALNNLDINSAGTTNVNNAINIGALTTDAGGTTRLNGNITSSTDQTYNDPVFLDQDLTLRGTAGNITFNGTVASAAGVDATVDSANQLIINQSFTSTGGSVLLSSGLLATGNTGNINGGTSSLTIATNAFNLGTTIAGSGTLTIRPLSPATSIGIAGAAGTLQVANGTLSLLQNGFASITFGSPNQTGNIAIGAITFQDPIIFQAPGGSVNVNGVLRGIDNTSFNFISSNATTILAADVITAGAPITFGNNVQLAPTNLQTITVDSTDGGNTSTGATINFAQNINGSSFGNQSLVVNAGTSAALFGGLIGSTVPLNNLTISSGSTLTQAAAWNVRGTTSLAVGNANDITLGAANDFNSIFISTGNNAVLTDINNLALGNMTLGGNLTVNAGGVISQAIIASTVPIPTRIVVAGNAAFTTTLGNTGNVAVTNSTATVIGNSVIGGDFTLNSTGNSSQAPGTTLAVAGNLNVTSGGTNTLTNNTVGNVTLANGDVIISQVGLITLAPTAFAGNVTVNSLASGQQFNGVFGGTAIALTSAANSFGGTLSLNTANAGISNVTATPGITQSGALSVPGLATFNATQVGNITLLSPTNSFNSLAFIGNAVSITQQNAIALLASSAAGNLVLLSESSIAQTGALSIAGTSTIGGGAVVLANSGNFFTGPIALGSLTDATLFNNTDTQLSLAAVQGNLTVTSAGNLALPIGGNLSIISGGLLSQDGEVFVGSTLLLNAGANTVAVDGNVISGNLSIVGGAINLNAPLQTLIGDATLSNSGLLTITSTAPLNIAGAFQQNGSGSVNTAGSLTASSIQFNSSVFLSGSESFTATNGSVALNSTVDGFQDLTITTGTGNISFLEAVGSNTALGNLNVNSSGTTVFNSTVNAGNLTTDVAGSTQLAGNVVTGGNQTFNGNLLLLNPLALTSGANITFNATVSSGNTPVSLNATAANTIAVNNSVNANGVNLTATSLSSSAAGTINAGSGNSALVVDSIALKAPVTGSGFLSVQPRNPINSIGIAGADGILQLSTETIRQFTNGFQGITIGSTNQSGNITVNTVTFLDPITLQTPGGSLFINGQFNGLDNASIDLISSDNTTVLNANIVTAGNPIFFRNSVRLGNTVLLDTTNGGGNIPQVGTITFSKTLDATNAGVEGLTLQTGGGDQIFTGAVGAQQALGNLTITNAANVTFSSSLQAGNILQSSGASSTSFNGSVSASSLNLTGTGFAFNAPVTTSANITIANSGSLRISSAAALSVGGAFAQIGNGVTDVSGNISTLNSGIRFNGPVLVSAPSTLSTNNGDVFFANTLNGNNLVPLTPSGVQPSGVLPNSSLTILAGQGNVTFSNTVGSSSNSTPGINVPVSTFGGSLTSLQVSSANINANNVNAGLITFTATGNISTGNLTAGSGGMNLSAAKISTGVLDSSVLSPATGNAGNITLTGNQILVSTINAQSANGTGGTVDVTSQTTFQAVGSFNDLNNRQASISTASGGGGAPITIRHLGGVFTVGNAATNGTAASISSRASNNIDPVRSFPGSFTQDDIRIITTDQNIAIIPAPEKIPTPILSSPINLGTVDTGSVLPNPANIEQSRTAEFVNYFGPSLPENKLSTTEIQSILRRLARETGKKPAILYIDAFARRTELVLVTPDGEPILRIVPDAPREAVLAKVREFRNEVLAPNKRNSNSFLAASRQLYQWFITPIEGDLREQKIDTLVFSLDRGLRHVPLAALNDGKQYLVEKYGLSLIPSINLVDTRYGDVKKAQVLAMGASSFDDDNPLPAVPLELSAVVKEVGGGRFFLNKEFTLANLKSQRLEKPFGIIHLATHADFNPGPASASFIKLSDTRLGLDRRELQALRWNDPPVELLVLSACRTAIGDENAELGFAGLAVGAGVKTAIASLWYASDEGTLALMTGFYEQLKNAPIKAEALRAVQIDMILGRVRIEKGQLITPQLKTTLPEELKNLGNVVLTHPYYWSGFTMIGSPW